MQSYQSIIGCGLVIASFALLAGGCASTNPARQKGTVQLRGHHPESSAGSAHHDLADGKSGGTATEQTEHTDRRHERTAGVSQDERSQFVPTGYPEPFGANLTEHWSDPWPHSHFSRRGTPFTHLFITEPAFLDRDLFLDTRIIRGAEGDEIELETELEWALTRRIGLVIEAPLHFVNPADGSSEQGFGDIAIAPRFLMLDTDRLLLSFNLEVEIPAGSERRGLGRGETALSPTVSWWYDLGRWVAWSEQVGTEHGLKSGEDELVYNTALAYSVLGPALFEQSHAEFDHGGRHFPAGMINFITEFTGKSAVSGEERGRSTGALLVGTSYLLTSSWEVRVAVQFPLFKPRDFYSAYIFSLIHHF